MSSSLGLTTPVLAPYGISSGSSGQSQCEESGYGSHGRGSGSFGGSEISTYTAQKSPAYSETERKFSFQSRHESEQVLPVREALAEGGGFVGDRTITNFKVTRSVSSEEASHSGGYLDR